ncbi:ribosomal-protein-alanine N-acetyltransferase [Chitinophaga jiangningensis]|uniref:Ribosomal-protein-alanine N-acetyltransferase n=1 Tax=Chitinophaga jiangningensis TaxID=1419482 RepID=A0A1M7CN73_9BACT|nr:GNAT family protein [Chitinophaga jiangningensis]SHL68714.1 ribosomal-protein-alanine N-acetyltransferase [Chitinophaga jiangningensis]
MNKLPDIFPQLTTDRLLLEPVTMDMLEDIFFLFTDPHVVRFYHVMPFSTMGKAMELIRHFHKAFREKEGIRWAMILKGSRQVIGTIGLHQFNASNRAAFSFDISSNWWKKGFLTEAMHAVLHYAYQELQLHRIQAEVVNLKSDVTAILDLFGFVKEGQLRDWQRHNDVYGDMHVYALLKNEYRGL